MDNQNKNLIYATVLSFLVILAWTWLFPPQTTPTADQLSATTPEVSTPGSALTAADGASPAGAVATTAAGSVETTATVATDAPRVAIETPRLSGSISLLGGRIDELALGGTDAALSYRETLASDSADVKLLSPVGEDLWYYATFGWFAADVALAGQVPNENTVWSLESGETLTPATPVSLIWDNGHGLIFRRTMSVDENYMFSVEQSVENTGSSAVSLAPYGFIARHSTPPDRTTYISHQGAVRVSDGKLQDLTYKAMTKLDVDPASGWLTETVSVADSGWVGFADKYWMTALVPTNGEGFTSQARYSEAGNIYQTVAISGVRSVAPGETVTAGTRLFAGAKEWEVLRDYQDNAGIARFIDAIDWGWFYFLTKPIFWLLHMLHGLIGNMGVSIIGLTILVKAVALPLAYKSYISMARMKELQPEIQALKERVGEDRAALQRETMELYKRRKVNPASGCLPVLIQIPIFFSLYKVIFNTIELRQAPFIWWIHDLSAPDPTSILNLFGLLPYAAPSQGSPLAILSLGVFPILLGISMWLQQKLNPTPAEPTQAAVMAWMPWIFMFMLGSFASGLVLYWISNNTMTFIQQYLIMRSHGHHPDVFGNILGSFRRKAPAVETGGKTSKKK